jgi:hypothetical protein
MKFKAKVDDNGVQIETCATLLEIETALTLIIHDVYENLSDDTVKAVFKETFTANMKDGLPFLDDDEREALMKKHQEEREEKQKDMRREFDKLLDKLKGLLRDD